MTDITRILDALEKGDPHAAAQLLPLVYDELRKLAAARLAREKPGQTLDATALVHEAWMRLAGGQSFVSRSHFFRASAEAMRRILVDRARARNADKRGGHWTRVELADWYTTPVHPVPFESLHEVGLDLAECPEAVKRCAEIVSLPVNARVTKTSIERAAALFAAL